MTKKLDEPVRQRPDYGEEPFAAEEKKMIDEDEVVEAFLRDYRSGVLRDLPLGASAFADCVREYGAAALLADPVAPRRLAESANRQVALYAQNQRANQDGLAVQLADAFGRAIRSGQLPKREEYLRRHAEAFVYGAIGRGPSMEPILERFALAHNIKNTDLGVIVIGESSLSPRLISISQMSFVKMYLDQMADFSEETDPTGSRFYPMNGSDPTALWSYVRKIEQNFPEMDAVVENEGGPLMNIFVREVGEAGSGSPIRDYPGIMENRE
jgi:hypothetical protein